MRENIQKITYDKEKDIIRCGDLFTIDRWVRNLDWVYVAKRCGVNVNYNRSVTNKTNMVGTVTVSFLGDDHTCNSITNQRVRGGICGTKEKNKKISEMLGMPPKRYAKILRGIQHSVWRKGKEDLVNTYCFNKGGQISREKIHLLNKHIDVVRQYEKDRLHHLVPFALFFGKTTKEMKEIVGKSCWKSLCKNTKSRNKLIALRANNNGLRVLQDAAKLSTSTLKKDIIVDESSVWGDNVARVEKVLSHKHGYVSHYAAVYSDTRRMADRLDLPFNKTWSKEKMLQKHDEYIRKIEEEKYPDVFMKSLDKIEPKVYTKGDYEARLLTTPLQIKLQGNSQKHCVASYATSVANGNYLVYSINDKDSGEVLSTVGLKKAYRGEAPHRRSCWRISQHYGPCNSTVSLEQSVFAEELELLLSINTNGRLK